MLCEMMRSVPHACKAAALRTRHEVVPNVDRVLPQIATVIGEPEADEDEVAESVKANSGMTRIPQLDRITCGRSPCRFPVLSNLTSAMVLSAVLQML